MTKQFKRSVLSLLIYIHPREAKLPTDYSTVVDKQVVNRFSYPVIKLWHYVEAIRQGNYPELAPLLPALTKQPDELLLVADILVKISYGDSFKRRLSK